MKSKLLVALVGIAFVLGGCGSTSAASETTIAQWAQSSGLLTALQQVSTDVGELGTKLNAVDQTDITAVVKVLGDTAQALAADATAIAGVQKSDDAAFEQARTAAADAISAYAEAAKALAAAPKAELQKQMAATTAALGGMTAAIKSLSDYVTSHKDAVVHPAS